MRDTARRPATGYVGLVRQRDKRHLAGLGQAAGELAIQRAPRPVPPRSSPTPKKRSPSSPGTASRTWRGRTLSVDSSCSEPPLAYFVRNAMSPLCGRSYVSLRRVNPPRAATARPRARNAQVGISSTILRRATISFAKCRDQSVREGVGIWLDSTARFGTKKWPMRRVLRRAPDRRNRLGRPRNA